MEEADRVASAPGKDGREIDQLILRAMAVGREALSELARAAITRKLQAAGGELGLISTDRLFDDRELAELADAFAATVGTAQLLGRAQIRKRREDVLRQRGILESVLLFECGGPGSGVPGPCPSGVSHNLIAKAAEKVHAVAGLAAKLPRKVVAHAVGKVKEKFAALEARYGRKYAIAIMAAGIAAAPIPIPGSSLVAALPIVGMAEFHRSLSRPAPAKIAEASEPQLSAEQIAALGKQLLKELAAELADVDLHECARLDVPELRQEKPYSCGASALGSVLAYFGLPETEEQLRIDLGTNSDNGTDPEAILQVAAGRGLDADGRDGLTLGDLAAALDAGFPVLCPIQAYGSDAEAKRLQTGHWVVVIGYDCDSGELYLQDPVAGHVTLSPTDFERAWHDQDAAGNVLSHYGIVLGRGLQEDDRSGGMVPMTPTRAIEYFTDLVPTLGIDPQRFGDDLRRRAFTMAVATDREMLSRVQTTIGERLRSGQGFSAAPREINTLLDAAGVSPANPQYAEMVFRTNTHDAYHQAGDEAMRDPDVVETFPVWQYSNPDDSRSRPAHAERNGNYYPANIPFTQVRGTDIEDAANCRCDRIPIDKWLWAKAKSGGAKIAGGYPDVPSMDEIAKLGPPTQTQAPAIPEPAPAPMPTATNDVKPPLHSPAPTLTETLHSIAETGEQLGLFRKAQVQSLIAKPTIGQKLYALGAVDTAVLDKYFEGGALAKLAAEHGVVANEVFRTLNMAFEQWELAGKSAADTARLTTAVGNILERGRKVAAMLRAGGDMAAAEFYDQQLPAAANAVLAHAAGS